MNDPNLIGNTRIIDIPEDLVHRDVYEYIVYVAELIGILPNGVHDLPGRYKDVIDAINRISEGEGLEIIHGGFFSDGTESNIISHDSSELSHRTIKLDAGQVEQINNELVSVIEQPEERADDYTLADHNKDQYAHSNIVADGDIIDGEVILDNVTLDEHNENPNAHGGVILDGNIEDHS